MAQNYLDISVGTKIKHEMWNTDLLNPILDQFFKDDYKKANDEMLREGIMLVELKKPQAKKLIKFLKKEIQEHTKKPQAKKLIKFFEKLQRIPNLQPDSRDIEQIKEFIVELNKAFKGNKELTIQWGFD